MKKIAFFVFALSVLLLVFGCTQPKDTGSLVAVFDNPLDVTNSLNDSSLKLLDSNMQVIAEQPVTDASGAVIFDSVPAGNYSIGVMLGMCVLEKTDSDTSVPISVKITKGNTTNVSLHCLATPSD